MSLSVNKVSVSPSFGNDDNKGKGPSAGKIVGEAVVAGGIGAGVGYGNYKLSAVAEKEKSVASEIKELKDAFIAEYKSTDSNKMQEIKDNVVRDILKKESDKLNDKKLVDSLKANISSELEGRVSSNKLEEIAKSYIEDAKNAAKPFENEIAEYQAAVDDVAKEAILKSENVTKKADGAIESMTKANTTIVEKMESAAKKSFTKTKLAYAGLAAAGALGLYAGGRYLVAQAKKES